jgi:hypothetical protein
MFTIFILISSCEKEKIEIDAIKPPTDVIMPFYFIAGEVSSNVNYVDLTPDRTLLPELNNSSFVYVDLFDDNSWDFKIQSNWEGSSQGIWEDIFISNEFCNYFEIAIDTSLTHNYYGVFANVFNEGDTINSKRNNWINGERIFLTSTYNGNTIGPWINQIDKYIGIRNIIGIDTIYSWVRFSNEEENNYPLICHDYAFVNAGENGN